MPAYTLPIGRVLHELPGAFLGRVLLFPEVTHLGGKAESVLAALDRKVKTLAGELPPQELFRRHLPSAPELTSLSLEIEPPARSALYTSPIVLTLPLVRFRHGETRIAYAPSLCIEVLGRSDEELAERLPIECREALAREGALTSPRKLVEIDRLASVRLELRTLELDLPSARERAAARRLDEAEDERSLATLPRVATELAEEALPTAHEVDEPVARLAELLLSPARQSVLLVGPPGCGKTAVLKELVRRRKEMGLARVPFWSTSGARLVAGMTGYGMWQERVQAVCREAVGARAVLHLGNLVELLEVGKAEGQLESVASFLRPRLSRRELLAVAECAPEQLAVIERRDPALLRAFVQLRVPEPSAETTRLILLAATMSRHEGPRIDVDGLEAIARLHARYATASANPGRPLRFLDNLLLDTPPGESIAPADVELAFARQTGLPAFLLDRRQAFDAGETVRWLTRRVAGQPEAVELVVDVLATAVAALGRPRRPLASFLFIGPTGVGKTETAKALAELLFGSRDRLCRFDMTEYGDPLAVKRLVGGVFGSEGLLTARVREQPFSVVLLDELEKADPLFFDLLLQMLGEGRLTDAAGRVADFANAVVIMTSNLGGRSFGKAAVGLEAGPRGGRDPRRHFEEEVRSFVRPELYNRIDRIVPFLPLSQETLLGIARRHLAELSAREGARSRDLELELPEDVVLSIARSGFDPRYGVRPLRRAIERELLAPMAAEVNRHDGARALTARASLAGGRLAVEVRERTDKAGRPLLATGKARAETGPALLTTSLRREAQRLARSGLMLEVGNELARLRRLSRDGRRRPPALEAQLAAVPALQALLDRQRALGERIEALEERVLLGLWEGAPHDGQEPGPAELERRVLAHEQRELLVDLVARSHTHPHRAFLAIFSEHPAAAVALARAHWERRAERRALYVFKVGGGKVARSLVKEPDAFWGSPGDDHIGVGLDLSGRALGLLLESEPGLHPMRLAGENDYRDCLVAVAASPETLVVPKGAGRRGTLAGQQRRRCDLGRRQLEDDVLGRTLAYSGQRFAETLAEAIEEAFSDRLYRHVRVL